MDFNEQDFMRKLKETFRIEAAEHLQSLPKGLLTIENEPNKSETKELINVIFREAHSLKGAARAVNHTVIQNICQSLENVLSSLRSEKIDLNADSFDVLYNTIELIQKYITFEEELTNEKETLLLGQLIDKLELLAEGQPLPEKESEPEEKAIVKEEPPPPVIEKKTKSPPPKEDVQVETPPPPKKVEEPSKEEIQKEASDTTIRVSTNKLDAVLQQIEEMLVVKLTSGKRVAEINHIIKDFEQWELEKKRIQQDVQNLRQSISRQYTTQGNQINPGNVKTILEFFTWQEEHMKEFRDKILNLKKETAQDYRISENIVDSLLEETKKVLMQPFNTLLEAFPLMVRDICRSVGKEVQFEIDGADIEVDRRILEEIKDPLIHLIRNSIDHGIELPKIRAENNKPPKGTLQITITQISGSNVEICISDDGAGIDINQVKKAAIRNGAVEEKDLEGMDDNETLMLMFQSGVTTSEIITDLSGRGVGLGVVSEKVEKLGGQIIVETECNEGTTFRIRLPVTLATFRGIHIHVQGQGFIIPTHHMLRVLRLDRSEIKTIEGKEVVSIDGKNISFINLKEILGLPNLNKKEEQKEMLYIMVIRASDLTVALGVDQILNEQEVFTKNLGKQLTRVKNIAAATVMEWGKVIPILDPFDIVQSATKGTRTSSTIRKSMNNTDEKRKTLLIAEDTVTARMLLKNILDSAGYIVKTAVDGAEAYSILMQEEIDLLLSDIEMPRMTGFELAAKVRETESLEKLPIVLCSSLSTKEDKEKGVAVGANAYIVKSSFEQSNLLETIQKLL